MFPPCLTVMHFNLGVVVWAAAFFLNKLCIMAGSYRRFRADRYALWSVIVSCALYLFDPLKQLQSERMLFGKDDMSLCTAYKASFVLSRGLQLSLLG